MPSNDLFISPRRRSRVETRTLSHGSLKRLAQVVLPTAMVAGLAVAFIAPGAASAAASTPTQTAVASSADPSSGGAVTFTATVTSGGTSVGASGTVTFIDVTDGTTLCSAVALVSSGTATCATTGLSSAGTYAIAANYSGTSTYLVSNASISQLVQSGIPTQLDLSSSDNDISCTFGDCNSTYSVTYTASLTAASGQPSGTVAFTDDGTVLSGCGAVAVSGSSPFTATCTYSYVSPASLDDAIVATLTPTAGELASSAEIYEVIGSEQAESSTLALTDSANPLATGTAVTYTATMTGAFNGIPTGNVTFTDDGSAAACDSGSDVVALSSGVATCTISGGYPAANTEVIEALYTGSAAPDGYDNSYETADEMVTSGAATPTQTMLSSSADPSESGDVTYSVQVTASSGTPSGSVTVSDGTTSCMASLNGTGVGACALDEANAGTLTITASYPATNPFAGSGASITELITTPSTTGTTTSTTTTVGESAARAAYGDENAVTFSVTVTPTSGGTGPSDDVVTIDVGSASCPATLTDGYGSCSIGATALDVGGPYAVSATFSGDAVFSGSSSTNTLEFAINPATGGQPLHHRHPYRGRHHHHLFFPCRECGLRQLRQIAPF